MIKYIFFDLDETLIDIKQAQNNAIETLYYKHKFDEKTSINDFIKTWDELTDYHYKFYTQKQISYEEQRKRRIIDLFKKYNISISDEPLNIYQNYLYHFEQNWHCFGDVKSTLKNLKSNGYKLGLISNGDLTQQIQKMKNTKIYNYFDFINTSSEFPYSKPNKQLFETIFNKHNIPISEVCYVGDSYSKDILPCRELGIKTVLINRNKKEYNDNNLIQITSLKQIINKI